jgi:methionyl-tRNA formyltransferase
MKKVIVFGDLPIATKVCEEILKYPEVDLAGVVLGKKLNLKNNDPWDVPILKEYAIENKIPILDFDAITNEYNKYFLGISARFSRIIPKGVITSFKNGIINFHGGLLPEYAGLNSTCHEILENAKYGGGTIHYIDEGIDTGEIIIRCEVEILNDETSVSLFRKTQLALFKGFQEIFPKLLKDERLHSNISNKKGNYYDKNALNGKKEIDLTSMNKDDIYRITRAFDFPGHEPAYFTYNGKKIFLTTLEFFK